MELERWIRLSSRLPMPQPKRSKKEIYKVKNNKKVGMLVECDNCGFIDESTRSSKSKTSPSSSSSQGKDRDKDVTATESSKLTNIVTYYFKCPNCSAEKTVLEHEENDDEEDDNDDDNEDEYHSDGSTFKIWIPDSP